MIVALAVPAAIWASLASLPLAAQTDPLAQGLARCTVVTAPKARLACYDALAGQTETGAVPTGAVPPSAAVPASAGPVHNAPAVDAAQNFGFSPAQIHQTPPGPAAIEGRLTDISFNRGDFGQTYLRLDNGQVWKTRDDVARLAVGNPVKIRRAALGSFLLLDPSNLSYRVYRVK